MDLNHVAVFIDDLEKSSLAPALGGWGAPVTTITDQPVTVDGRPGGHSGRTRRICTASSPPFGISVEDVAPDAPIQPIPGNPWHHVAVWCDDIAATAQALEGRGYRKEVVGRGPDGELATFAYMVSDFGPRIELSDAAMRGPMREYFARAAAGEGGGKQGGLSAPLVPCEVAVVVAARLEKLRDCWQSAFGGEWSEVTETTMTVIAADSEQELHFRGVSSSGDPRVTIIAPEPESRSLLAPVDIRGWHHVALRSSKLAQDVDWLERCGLRIEFCDRGQDGQPQAFAMMLAPEGTRVKLVSE